MFSRRARQILVVLAAGSLSALGVLGTSTASFRLEPRSAGWKRLVRGAGPNGAIKDRAVFALPGLERKRPRQVLIAVDTAAAGERAAIGISIDGGPLFWAGADRNGALLIALSESATPGARIELRRVEGRETLRIRSLAVLGTDPPPVLASTLAFVFASGLTGALLARMGILVSAALGLLVAGVLSLAASPSLVFATLPEPASSVRLLLPMALLFGSVAMAWAADAGGRRRYWQGAGLLVAAIFGAWVRWYFLPSAGSWDTEYWKAWTMRAASHGVSRVYGDPGSVPKGHFLAQLRGEEQPWRVERHGRPFGVDYPPLAMALWRWSWWLVNRGFPGLHYAEAENVAVKLPAVLGDVAAIAILLWTLSNRPGRALILASLYWALPVSWLSSAALGFQDGAYAPLAVAALAAARRGCAGWAGALLALACLIKPLGALLAPAVATAVVAGGGRLGKAAWAGLGVTAIVLLPFAVDGTLAPVLVHCYRGLFPGNLSSGYANPWWIAGHLLTAMSEPTMAILAPVRFVRLEAVSFPAGVVGTMLSGLAMAWIVWRHRPYPGPGPAALAGAALFFAYVTLAVGVYENHPHLILLALAATGLASRRLQLISGAASASYVINMLLLSGLGRFYGQRHIVLEPVARWLSEARMAPGIDLTLVLAVANAILFILLLASLKNEFRHLADGR